MQLCQTPNKIINFIWIQYLQNKNISFLFLKNILNFRLLVDPYFSSSADTINTGPCIFGHNRLTLPAAVARSRGLLRLCEGLRCRAMLLQALLYYTALQLYRSAAISHCHYTFLPLLHYRNTAQLLYRTALLQYNALLLCCFIPACIPAAPAPPPAFAPDALYKLG